MQALKEILCLLLCLSKQACQALCQPYAVAPWGAGKIVFSGLKLFSARAVLRGRCGSAKPKPNKFQPGPDYFCNSRQEHKRKITTVRNIISDNHLSWFVVEMNICPLRFPERHPRTVREQRVNIFGAFGANFFELLALLLLRTSRYVRRNSSLEITAVRLDFEALSPIIVTNVL